MRTIQPAEILNALKTASSPTGLLLHLGIHDRTHMQKTIDRLSVMCGINVTEKLAENKANRSREQEEKSLVISPPRICKFCGCTFDKKYSVWSNGEYCSESCARKSCARSCSGTKNAVCTVCGATFDIDVRASLKTAKCPTCKREKDRERKKRNYQKRKELKTSSRQYTVDDLVSRGLLDKEYTTGLWDVKDVVSDGLYLCGCVANHPGADDHGHVLLHRLVAENATGKPLGSDVVVHHLNENKHDNRIANLKVLTKQEHASLHHRGKVTAVHGGITMYKNHGCRCAACVEAYREYMSRRKLEQKSR